MKNGSLFTEMIFFAQKSKMRYGRIGWGYQNFKNVFFFLVLYGEFKFELKNSLFDRRPPVNVSGDCPVVLAVSRWIKLKNDEFIPFLVFLSKSPILYTFFLISGRKK
jgi:hypothetical protein